MAADVFDAAAYDIGEDGTIVGLRFHIRANDGDQGLRATVWPVSGGIIDLGPGVALNVSAQGKVVGARPDHDHSGPFDIQAAIWTRMSEHTWDKGQLLPRLPNGHGSQALGINTPGNVVVGSAWDASDVEHAVRWKLISGQWQGPTLLDKGEFAEATLVNASGDAAGGGFPCGNPENCSGAAMFWPANGPRVDLGSLGIAFSSQIVGLSAAGEVVGPASTEDFRQFPFLWRPAAGTVIDLGILRDDEGGEARDINNHRQVVGTSYGSRSRAVLWSAR